MFFSTSVSQEASQTDQCSCCLKHIYLVLQIPQIFPHSQVLSTHLRQQRQSSLQVTSIGFSVGLPKFKSWSHHLPGVYFKIEGSGLLTRNQSQSPKCYVLQLFSSNSLSDHLRVSWQYYNRDYLNHFIPIEASLLAHMGTLERKSSMLTRMTIF